MPLLLLNASLIEPEIMVLKMLQLPAPPFRVTLFVIVVFTLIATSSMPTVEPDSQMRGSSGRFWYSRCRVEFWVVCTAVMPASNRMRLVKGFVHDTERRRFGRLSSEK